MEALAYKNAILKTGRPRPQLTKCRDEAAMHFFFRRLGAAWLRLAGSWVDELPNRPAKRPSPLRVR